MILKTITQMQSFCSAASEMIIWHLNQDAEIISKLLNTTIHNNNTQHTKRHTIKQFKQNTLIKFINKLKITKNPHFTSEIDKMG